MWPWKKKNAAPSGLDAPLSGKNWKKIQEEIIKRAIYHGGQEAPPEIIKQDISEGKVRGTFYYRKGTPSTKGLLFVHGMFANRYSFDTLASRMAEYGYRCLSIDLPSHFMNLDDFSLGLISETITEASVLLKRSLGARRLAVIAHSMGAVGTIFSALGYTRELEANIYQLWEGMSVLLKQVSTAMQSRQNEVAVAQLMLEFEKRYVAMKQAVYASMSHSIAGLATVDCYILIAPPPNCKTAAPGLPWLRRRSARMRRFLISIPHNITKYVLWREGHLDYIKKESDPAFVYWQSFKTRDTAEFLRYFLSVKEPSDMLEMLEEIIKFKKGDKMKSFFEYYLSKFLKNKPKLFIYGKYDLMLRPIKLGRGHIDKFYNSLGNDSPGNTEIKYGDFSHILHTKKKKMMAGVAFKDLDTTEKMMKFLIKNL